MRIGGFQELSLIDYPGKMASIVFTTGCSFKCPFCHNPNLVDCSAKEIPENYVLSFLEKRKKFIDAVAVCGGEPTIHPDLPDFCGKLKQFGFLVKLDTNGTNPEMLQELADKKLVDYVAMDIKTSFAKYEKAAGAKVNIDNIRQSIDIVRKLGNYEFRTTCVPGLVTEKDLLEIAGYLRENKANKKFFIQQFRPKNLLDKKFEKLKPYSEEELEQFKKKLELFFDKIEIRK
jgi:pyruvate formate lyase activating enzyme